MDGYWFWLHPTEKSVTSCQGEVTANPSARRQQALADRFQGHWGLDASLPPASPVPLSPSFTQGSVNHHLNKPVWPLLHIQMLTARDLCVVVLFQNTSEAFHKSGSFLEVPSWPFCYFQSQAANSGGVPRGSACMMELRGTRKEHTHQNNSFLHGTGSRTEPQRMQ